jgi:predicted GH43/DUF377 family glycosyl hydrolase
MRISFLLFIVCVSFIFNSCDQATETTTSSWQKDNSNPVLTRGEPYGPDFYAISDCWVIFHEGKYKMWYTGGGAVLPDEYLHSSIQYATSEDGIHWTKYDNNPVFDIDKTAWDSLGVETATVIIDTDAPENSRYKMWYAGQTFNDYRYEIGYAYSSDGIHWQREPNAVLKVGIETEWDNCFLEGPSVIKEDGIYKMWYAAYDCNVDGELTDGTVNIGYATSTDGISWTKHEGNPVMTVSAGQWDAVYVQDPHVIKYDNAYHMWYGGADVGDNYFQQTGYAFSDDGIHWVKSNHNPILKRGSAGQWDANTASFPSVLVLNDKVKMWYTGKDVEPLPDFPQPYFWEIGYAEKKLPATNELD